MGSLYLVLCGAGLGGLVYVLGKKAGAWYQWILAIGLYIWICLGVSFVYINSIGYHHQAARVGALFFGIVALAWAFLVARSMGVIGTSRKAQSRMERGA